MGTDICMVDPKYGRSSYLRGPASLRWNGGSLTLILTAMERAGVLGDDPGPTWPEFPPSGISESRLSVIYGGLSEEHDFRLEFTSAEISAEERSALATHAAREDEVRSTPSRHGGKVAGFKFRSNDGWLVSPEECGRIASALTAYLDRLDLREFGALERLFASSYSPDVVHLDLSLEQVRSLLRDWIEFNARAAGELGYEVL